MESVALIIGIIFFITVGYFSFNFGQCIAKFSRLSLLINQKFFGILFLAFYIYYVYSNQVEIMDVLLASLR
tara:strand:+ start:3185 stop:3397 length:213 start_codon:yes stop_codon:yes gene_type:complete